jgi:hypothetical protein
MPNKRISDLNETKKLYNYNTEGFRSSAKLYDNPSDEESFLLLARTKIQNEKVKFKRIKGSLLDNALYLTGKQLVSGSKTFANSCTFLSRTNVSEIIDKTLNGDISGNIFVGESGLFQNMGIGKSFSERSDEPEYTLDISGDSCFFGDLTQTGDFFQSGDFLRIGESKQIGDTVIFGDKTVTENIYAKENIFHYQDLDTFINFQKESTSIQAGDDARIEIQNSGNQIIFDTSNQEQVRLTESGRLAINNADPLGQLSVTGKTFIQDIFVFDEATQAFTRVYGGRSENISFKTQLLDGADKQNILLPKQFHSKPIISAVLENKNGGVIIPICIENVTKNDFDIKLGSILTSRDYYLHTIALEPTFHDGVNSVHYENYPNVTCLDPANNRYNIQRFSTQVQEESDEVQIFFPFGFKETPSVSVTIEGPNNIVPYTISSVNNDSYKIIFGTKVNQNYTIHTFSSKPGFTRLG